MSSGLTWGCVLLLASAVPALAIAGAQSSVRQSVSAREKIGRTIPAETAALRESGLPGYALVRRNCPACHSAQYILFQPPGLPRTYWDATVRKMKKPFGAAFPDDDIPAMVDYLAKTYGAERPPSEPDRRGAAPAPKAGGPARN